MYRCNRIGKLCHHCSREYLCTEFLLMASNTYHFWISKSEQKSSMNSGQNWLKARVLPPSYFSKLTSFECCNSHLIIKFVYEFPTYFIVVQILFITIITNLKNFWIVFGVFSLSLHEIFCSNLIIFSAASNLSTFQKS